MFSPAIRRASTSLKNCIRFLTAAPVAMADYKEAHSIYDFTVKDIKGQPVSLEKYRGHVCIIVNVASQCGYTKTHYDQLVELYGQYHDSKGLCILGKPQVVNKKSCLILCFIKKRFHATNLAIKSLETTRRFASLSQRKTSNLTCLIRST